MLDLNVDVVSVDSTYYGSQMKIAVQKLPQGYGAHTDDTGTSSSSVVNADEPPPSVGDENSSSTHTRPSDAISAFNFDVFNRAEGNITNEIKDECYENLVPHLVTRQFFPITGDGGVGDSDEFTSRPRPRAVPVPGLLRQKWLNLTVPESGAVPELRIFETPKQQAPQPQVRKSRRGPRSRSSQYRGVTFYRRTGRWESHIWDCGKQVYLGGFDTAHAAARAYDRAAIKFRGVDADINFNISDYDEDMQQMKNLTKEEFVHVLRRQSTGFSRGSSRYRGVTLHKCGRWEARMGQLLGKKAYDKAAINCNGQEAVTNFDPSTYEGDPSLVANHGGSGHNLDLNLWVSPPQNSPKGNINVKDLRFHSAPYQLPDGKRPRVDSSAPANGLTMPSEYIPIWPAKYPGFTPNYEEEEVTGKREGEAVPSLGFTKWAWQMQQGHHGMVSPVPRFTTTTTTATSTTSNAASSGFSSTISTFSNPLLLSPTNHHTYLSYGHKT